jgi:glyoxylase-like metal-dependent hydrolase (beta-lactamase superfamily II)/rhodanese-related sulfurtransferase
MFFEQILREDIGCAAYLVGSDAGEAAVIDPRVDMVDELIEIAEREGLHIRYVVETHNHADHVAGHHELAQRTGATIAIHADAGVEYPHRALHDGDELTLGAVCLRVLHTPGHRPEHIALALVDTTRGDDPWVVLTGDSLFIGDVARPDLAIDGEQGAAALFHSLRERLATLPDGTLVYPAHVAGSLCGRVTNRMTATTIGYERRYNPALALTDKAAFVRYMNESLPERPPNLARIVALNKAAAPPQIAEPQPLAPADVERLLGEGALALDVRLPKNFARGHIAGAVAVALHGSQFPNRAGMVLPPMARLILVTDDAPQVATTVRALAVAGFTTVAGYLDGGMSAWQASGRPVELLREVSVQSLREEMRDEAPMQLVDVRDHGEWEEGHIDGARNIPFQTIPEQAATLDRAQQVYLICGSGERSTIAASLLQPRGFTVTAISGGMDAWSAAGFPQKLELKSSTT